MTEEEIKAVQQSWQEVAQRNPSRLGDIFYKKLFEQAPHLKPLFKVHMEEQSKRFSNMLGYIIHKLDDSSLIKEIRELARKHGRYGLGDEQYEYVGNALFSALQECAGRRWNASELTAWSNCFTTLSYIMKQSSREGTGAS